MTIAGQDLIFLPRLTTLRAGEGFSSQSSKWIHFGSGDAAKVQRIAVNWPGGPSETFSGMALNGRYHLVQGTGVARQLASLARDVKLVASTTEVPPPTAKARSVLAYRPPLPRLSYTTIDGKVASLVNYRKKPVLVTLWASWCSACLAEFGEISNERQRFRDAGLDVVALCVDGLNDERGVDAKAAHELLTSKNIAIAGGMVTADTLDRLHLTIDQLYIRDIPSAVPLSLLLDGNGRLAELL